ncbi:MAG: hypothetical protein AAGC60_14950 [Acidobacteriota bacterium]
MFWLIAALAALGLVTSLGVHGSTFFGVDPSWGGLSVWWLHGSALGLCALLWALAKARGLAAERVFERAPRWMLTTTACLFIYALVNFGLFFANSWEGMPVVEPDGTFAVRNHGDFVRSISEDEFHHLRALEVRGLSGHWMLFYSWSLSAATSAARDVGSATSASEHDHELELA